MTDARISTNVRETQLAESGTIRASGVWREIVRSSIEAATQGRFFALSRETSLAESGTVEVQAICREIVRSSIEAPAYQHRGQMLLGAL